MELSVFISVYFFSAENKDGTFISQPFSKQSKIHEKANNY